MIKVRKEKFTFTRGRFKLKKSGVILLSLVGLLLVALALFIYSNLGLRLMVTVAEKFVPELQVEQANGSLHDLTLVNVSYKTVGIDVSVAQTRLSLSGACILEAKLCIKNFALEGLTAKIDSALMPPSSSDDTASNEPLTDLQAPRPIQFQQVSLKNIDVTVDGNQIQLAEFSSGFIWVNRIIELYPTQLNGLNLQLAPAAANIAANSSVSKKTPVNESKSKSLALGEQIKQLFSQPLLASLPQITLPLDLTIKDFSGRDWQLHGDTPLAIDQFKLQMSNRGNRLRLTELTLNSPDATLDLALTMQLEGDWPIEGRLNATLEPSFLQQPLFEQPLIERRMAQGYLPQRENITLGITGNLNQQIKLTAQAQGSVDLQLEASTSLGVANLPLALSIQSQHLQWPIVGPADVQADNLNFSLKGVIDDYALSLSSVIQGNDIPKTAIKLAGQGDLSQFTLAGLELSLLNGSVKLKGDVNWQDQIRWHTELQLNNIQTDPQYPDYPAQLSGIVDFNGRVHWSEQPSDWQVEIANLAISGRFKQQVLDINGQISGNSQGVWQIPDFSLLLGDNNLVVRGELGEQFALDAEINFPDLSYTVPGLLGYVQGNVYLRGNAAKPQLKTNLALNHFQWQGAQIAKASLSSDITSDKEITGRITVKLEQLIYDGVNIKTIALNIDGSETNHRLRLDIDGQPIGGALALSGQFDRATQFWQGKLNDTYFNTPLGQWALDKSVDLTYNNRDQSATIASHCWVNKQGVICNAKPVRIAERGQASIELRQLDLAILQPMLGETAQLMGSLGGKLDIGWQPESVFPQLALALKGRNVMIEHQVGSNILPVPFDELALTLQLNDNFVQADWLVQISHNGKISGNLKIDDPQNSKRLAGALLIDQISLSLLQPIFAENESGAGLLNANLRFGGNLTQPQLHGDLNFTGIKVEGSWLPIDMVEANLGLRFNGSASALQGQVKTKQGQLSVSGNADWRELDNWRANMALNGEQINITLPPIVSLNIAPNIAISASPKLINLSGRIDIPSANITVEQLPASVVSVSSDEVMLDNKLQPINAKTATIPIQSNLVISLGNNVRLDAFGLTARLKGDLNVRQDKQDLGLHGQILIQRGKFRAYGQDLIIRRGQLLFAGPVSDPLLNVEAIRNPNSIENGVTAGIRVTGLADKPNVELFSDPAMEQRQILSYLLRGQGLDNSGDSDNDMMTAMLIGLGTAQTGRLVGAIGETFGIRDLTLDTQGVGESSQVVVSGYILPNLQVKYGMGIFDALATLTLRYRLMPRLYLEAVSGLEQAVDLIYQFNF